MGNTNRRFFSGILALALCLTCLALPAAAQADNPKDEVIIYTGTEPTQPPETTPPASKPAAATPPQTEPAEPDPTIAEPGEPFSKGSDIITRDMLYDKATNKQFITVQDREGNYFYIVIDYDAPLNEEEEGYQVYFLNPVDIQDLEALTQTEETEPAVCICTQHCKAGAIRMDCPICASNMAQCAGVTPETTEPTVPKTEPIEEPEASGSGGAVLGLLLILALGGGAAWYFLKNKSSAQTKGDTDLDDYDYGEDDPWENEDDQEDDGEKQEEGAP